MSVYQQFGVEPIINAAGTLTRLGGGPMPDAVLQAMAQAGRESVVMEELHARASAIIARATRTESALVTSGASAALTLGTAAILAGNDLARIDRLPDTAGFPNEFLVARDQRNGYDHAVRACGAKLVEVGMNEIVAGSGVRPVEVWEYAASRTDRTAGVLYVQRSGGLPRLEEVVRWAHAEGLPVLVDAAAELPPAENLWKIPASGADLVAFSGGKAIRGPQATGMLVGKRTLIESAALQMLDTDERAEFWAPPNTWIDPSRWPALPRQGIGRGFKVGKEQIVGLLVALEFFLNQDADSPYDIEFRRHVQLVEGVTDIGRSGISATVQREGAGPSEIRLRIDRDQAGISASEIVRKLRASKPAIYLRAPARDDELTISLATVAPAQDRTLRDRLTELLRSKD